MAKNSKHNDIDPQYTHNDKSISILLVRKHETPALSNHIKSKMLEWTKPALVPVAPAFIRPFFLIIKLVPIKILEETARTRPWMLSDDSPIAYTDERKRKIQRRSSNAETYDPVSSCGNGRIKEELEAKCRFKNGGELTFMTSNYWWFWNLEGTNRIEQWTEFERRGKGGWGKGIGGAKWQTVSPLHYIRFFYFYFHKK